MTCTIISTGEELNLTCKLNKYNMDCYKQADEHMIDDSDLAIIVRKADQNDSSEKYAECICVKVEYFPI